MNYLKNTVKFLTIIASFYLASCSLIHERYADSCNSHAYLNRELHEFLKSRFHYNSPVRMAIIPFSVPANLTAKDTERPGLGNEIAWQVHSHLLKSGEIPIVEVFNRQDWPYKKEEFFTGNFGGLDMAREAGYDLVLVGYIEPQRDIRDMTSYVKVMDADSGVTVYYGKITATSIRRDFDEFEDATPLLSDYHPSRNYQHEIKEKLASCISEAVLSDDEED